MKTINIRRNKILFDERIREAQRTTIDNKKDNGDLFRIDKNDNVFGYNDMGMEFELPIVSWNGWNHFLSNDKGKDLLIKLI